MPSRGVAGCAQLRLKKKVLVLPAFADRLLLVFDESVASCPQKALCVRIDWVLPPFLIHFPGRLCSLLGPRKLGFAEPTGAE
jgi:hypothetical protein